MQKLRIDDMSLFDLDKITLVAIHMCGITLREIMMMLISYYNDTMMQLVYNEHLISHFLSKVSCYVKLLPFIFIILKCLFIVIY